jgi:hypothetical protein
VDDAVALCPKAIGTQQDGDKLRRHKADGGMDAHQVADEGADLLKGEAEAHQSRKQVQKLKVEEQLIVGGRLHTSGI